MRPRNATCYDLRIVHGTLHIAPHLAAIADATVVLSGGRIESISEGSTSGVATESQGPSLDPCVVDAEGRFVLAGFWNSHVHHTDPALNDDDQASKIVGEMFAHFGFTSVVDTGADPQLLASLGRQIESGQIAGPHIVAAGGSFVYQDGTPSYLPRGLLPEITTPDQAPAEVARVLGLGAEGIKIFSGSFQSPTETIHLPLEVIAAIAASAHERGAFVVSHPTDQIGLELAVNGGVDVLAHTTPTSGEWEAELVQRMITNRVALIPTLKLWRWELEGAGVPPAAINAYVATAIAQLKRFHQAGGEVLFGTDVGYMRDFDTAEEFALMQRAGMGFDDILMALTTNPALRFGDSPGTLIVGAPADLVILDGDPVADARAFASVFVTIRGGKVQYRQSR
ncbi:MAG: amidohydrolase family protein [Nannocystaceae bacterium]